MILRVTKGIVLWNDERGSSIRPLGPRKEVGDGLILVSFRLLLVTDGFLTTLLIIVVYGLLYTILAIVVIFTFIFPGCISSIPTLVVDYSSLPTCVSTLYGLFYSYK